MFVWLSYQKQQEKVNKVFLPNPTLRNTSTYSIWWHGSNPLCERELRAITTHGTSYDKVFQNTNIHFLFCDSRQK
jgi:hypothetical protein